MAGFWLNRQKLVVLLWRDCCNSSLLSEEQLKAFIAKAKDDQSIQEKLKAAKALEDVVVIAKAAGFLISTDELKAQE